MESPGAYRYVCLQVTSSLASNLGHVVFGSFSTLRNLPIDVLLRSFDIARLAVYAAGEEETRISTCLKVFGNKRVRLPLGLWG